MSRNKRAGLYFVDARVEIVFFNQVKKDIHSTRWLYVSGMINNKTSVGNKSFRVLRLNTFINQRGKMPITLQISKPPNPMIARLDFQIRSTNRF